jgi:hypothetical protein
MDGPDLVSRVQQRARLHGPNQTRRAIRAVVDALVDAVPVAQSRRLAMRVATETGAGLPESALSDHDGHEPGTGCRAFVATVARRLFIDEPNAAFLARVVFGELNSAGHGITPAGISGAAPADLRPLLTSGAEVRTGDVMPERPGERNPRRTITRSMRVSRPGDVQVLPSTTRP